MWKLTGCPGVDVRRESSVLDHDALHDIGHVLAVVGHRLQVFVDGAKLDQLALAFPDFPILIGTSRKSFIGRLLDDAPAGERLHGTMASVTAAVLHGAHIIRVHDVKEAVETVRVADAIKAERVRRKG